MCRAYVLFWPWTTQHVQEIGPVAYLTNAKQVKSVLKSHLSHTPRKRTVQWLWIRVGAVYCVIDQRGRVKAKSYSGKSPKQELPNGG